jgi:hypothetical protein
MSTVVFTNPSVARETDTMSGGWIDRSYLLDGTPVSVSMTGAPLPCTIVLYPMSGDTLKVEQSRDGGNVWATLPSGGAVTIADTGFILTSGCTHIRVTRSAGTSSASYFTVC